MSLRPGGRSRWLLPHLPDGRHLSRTPLASARQTQEHRCHIRLSAPYDRLSSRHDLPMVYSWCMARTNIDIDEDACQTVMERYHLRSKREAVNLALRLVAAEPLPLDDARQLRGSGWIGDLDEMRQSRPG